MRRSAICFLAGGLLSLAFAPLHLWFLALFLPAVLAYHCIGITPRLAFWRAWLFGLGLALSGGSWVYVSIHRYGSASMVLAGVITFLFCAVMAVYFGGVGYAFARFFRHQRAYQVLAAFPALWMLSELLRSFVFTGLPWLLIGYSQTSTFLGAYASLGSVFLVSAMVSWINGLLLWMCLPGVKQSQRWLCLGIVLGLFGLGACLQTIHWTRPVGEKPLGISLVQGNIPEQLKWESAWHQKILSEYLHLSQQTQAPVLLWPETAIPAFPEELGAGLVELNENLKRQNRSLLTGIPLQDAERNEFYNAVIVLGQGQGAYLKHHLVPFGEYIPLSEWVGPIFDFLHLPMSELTPGDLQQALLEAQGWKWAVFICYESIFADQVREALQGADFIVTMSDDGWFGDSWGPSQHAQMDQMRAIETGRYLLRVNNDGLTAMINPRGQILESLPMDQAAVLQVAAWPMQGETPWMRLGLWPLILGLLGVLIVTYRKCR